MPPTTATDTNSARRNGGTALRRTARRAASNRALRKTLSPRPRLTRYFDTDPPTRQVHELGALGRGDVRLARAVPISWSDSAGPAACAFGRARHGRRGWVASCSEGQGPDILADARDGVRPKHPQKRTRYRPHRPRLPHPARFAPLVVYVACKYNPAPSRPSRVLFRPRPAKCCRCTQWSLPTVQKPSCRDGQVGL